MPCGQMHERHWFTRRGLMDTMISVLLEDGGGLSSTELRQLTEPLGVPYDRFDVVLRYLVRAGDVIRVEQPDWHHVVEVRDDEQSWPAESHLYFADPMAETSWAATAAA
jgi:hypothetical protein